MKYTLFFVAVIGCCLAGCGKVSAPIPPEGSIYPYPYVVEQKPS